MFADEWDYLAEGNHHIVLKYSGKKQSQTYSGKVLRFAKLGSPSDDSVRASFIKGVVQPLFTSKYIQHPVQVTISGQFLLEISARIDSRRPIGRRHKKVPQEECIGYIEPNLTVSLGTGLPACSPLARTICVEVKVKCGLLPCSPLIDEKSYTIKTNHSKYGFMQLVKCAQDRVGVTTPWGERIRAKSSYDPAELCSGDRAAVARACDNLVLCPQNNFIVYNNGELVYGLRETDIDRWYRTCNSFMQCSGDKVSADHCSRAVLDILSEVFCNEDILRRLQQLQALDILDVEGAHTVLAQLSTLMGGDTDRAIALVDACISSHSVSPGVLDIIKPRLTCCNDKEEIEAANTSESSSAPNLPWELADDWGIDHDCSVADLMVLEESLLHDLFLLHVSNRTPLFERLRRKQEAKMYISRLGKIECVLLLRLWLIALGAADASVMLCMSRSDDICWCMKESSSQTENAPGLCLHQCKDSTIGVVYSLSITDVGPKPASKVLSKAKVEGQLCVLAKQEVLLQGNSISL